MFTLYFTELDDETVFQMRFCKEVFLDTYYGYILVDNDCDKESPNEVDLVYEENKLLRLHILEDDEGLDKSQVPTIGVKEEYIVSLIKKLKVIDTSDSFYDEEEGGYICLFPSIFYKIEFVIVKKIM